MVGAWFMRETFEPNERELELHLEPPEYIDLDKLYETTGVLYWKIDVDRVKDAGGDRGLYERIRSERGYSYEDTIEISRDKLPDYDNKANMFFKEHFHADEEIRLVLEGSGYFDVRDDQDRWIRIQVERGDLIVLPAGIHHRFTLDSTHCIAVNRLFVGEPVWNAINRPNEDHPARKLYRQQLITGFSSDS